MSRALTLGNGNILVNIDHRAAVRDFYYPYVGLENQVGGHNAHRLGIYIEGCLSWLTDPNWEIKVGAEEGSFIGQTEAINEKLAVRLKISDVVYNEKNILVRRVEITNLSDREREIKLYCHQQFEMYESRIAHTAYYDPSSKTIIHYRNRRVFLVNAQLDGEGFDDFSTGVFSSEGKEGTHRDAEDGQLSKNPVEHGQADSVLGLAANYPPDGSHTVYYWLTVASSPPHALALNQYVLERGPGHLIETTRNFWHAWIGRQEFHLEGLDEDAARLFRQSLFIIRAHADDNGGIIASSDSTILQGGKDTYAYVWPRDAAYSALALTVAGDQQVARDFFGFCNEVISEGGYFFHKYSPDRSLGSSWHPWWQDGEPQLPIQEDETALVIWALWKYYEHTKDLEFVELVYNSLIKKAADFMVLFRDEKTKLPKPSYDLWEEKFGASTFTISAVYGGLQAAANFAKLLGKIKSEAIYRRVAEEFKVALLEHLYDKESGNFLKMVFPSGEMDRTVDVSSIYGVYHFGVLPVDDDRVVRAVRQTAAALETKGAAGGVARYDGDNYFQHVSGKPNPWFVTTLWLTQYRIAAAKNNDDLEFVRESLAWATKHARLSGVLSEQLHPETGYQLSVAPLTWSHAEYVLTITKYLNKMKELGLCQECNPDITGPLES
ncbi:MAG: glycoside hydrolase family 15 protein [Patescibacteria group bacterium]|nr:glycoside hydrolase family 15 protein [Patescibacteria group bacterium]